MKKIWCWLLIALNLTEIGFIAYYAATFNPSVTANIFGILMIATFFLDALFAMCSRRRSGFYYLLGFVAAMAVSLGTNYMSVLPAFKTGVGYGAIACMVLLYLGAVLLCVQALRGQPEKEAKHPAAFQKATQLFLCVSLLILLVFCIISYDVLFNYGYSNFELFIGGLLFYLALVAFGCMGLVFYAVFYDKRSSEKKSRSSFSAVCIVLCLVMGAISLFGFSKPILSVPANIKQGDQAYASAFSDEYLNKEGFRSIQFSVPEFFMGTKTTGYASEMDVRYYESTKDIDAGIKLAYDVYYPENDSNKPFPVLLRMHGAGGDKGTGNYPTPNKYFASKGYVVYDLQYGDRNENQGDGFVRPGFAFNQYSFYLRQFVNYAKANNNHNADWDNVFVSGNSMGGGVANAFALHFNRGDPLFDDLGITIKGLIPIYPASILEENLGGNSDWNALPLIDQNSVPCLMFMGTHDGYVSTEFPEHMAQAYKNADNNEFAVFTPQYAGHGSDGYFYGYYMQNFAYYMERFMAQYSS